MNHPDPSIISSLSTSLDVDLPENISMDDLQLKLSLHVNDLINNDFEKLVRILYRIDVSEEKLKKMLRESQGKNAADLIAALMIERQLQKLKSRRENSGQ